MVPFFTQLYWTGSRGGVWASRTVRAKRFLCLGGFMTRIKVVQVWSHEFNEDIWGQRLESENVVRRKTIINKARWTQKKNDRIGRFIDSDRAVFIYADQNFWRSPWPRLALSCLTLTLLNCTLYERRS